MKLEKIFTVLIVFSLTPVVLLLWAMLYQAIWLGKGFCK